MKICVCMKTPDCVERAITEAADSATEDREDFTAKCELMMSRWFRYGEVLTVEVDTVTGTCTVVEC